MKKGLTTEKKVVARSNKRTGKLSVYTQGYRVGRNKSDKPEYSKADGFMDDIKKFQTIDKRSTLKTTLSEIGNKGIGKKRLNLISSKVKNSKDVDTFIGSYFDNSLKTLNDGNSNLSKATLEHGSLINNLVNDKDSCKKFVKSLSSNKSQMSDMAFGSLITSFNDHNMVNEVIGVEKKESYEVEELRHDMMIKYTNPLFHIIGYNNKITDNIKSYVNNIFGKDGNLTYLSKGIKTTNQEQQFFYKFIDIINSYVHNNLSNIKLYNLSLSKVNKFAGAAITKNKNVSQLKLYNSTIYNMYEKIGDINDNFTFVKDIDVEESDNYMKCESSKVYLDENKNVIFANKLYIDDVKNYNFLALPKNKMLQVYDEFNEYLLSNINYSLFSKDDTQKKLDELYDNINNMTNGYLIISN